MLPTDLKARANGLARRMGISLGELIRVALEATVRGDHGEVREDTLLTDLAVHRGPAPADLAERHDHYLYDSDS